MPRHAITAQTDAQSRALLDASGARYLVLNQKLIAWQPSGSIIVSGRFTNIADWAGMRVEDFYETFYSRDAQGDWQPTVLYYPSYYQTLLVRLYVLRGCAAVPKDPMVITWRAGTDERGTARKEITSFSRFATYEEAVAFRDANADPSATLAGTSPVYSCVPTEPVGGFRRVYSSPTVVGRRSGEDVGFVEIYEVLGTGRG